MTIQLKDGVYWDTAAARQSAEAYAWMREENLSLLGMSLSEEGKHTPEMDKYKRPVRWVIEHEHCTVTITREYVEPDSPSWAMKRDQIVVTPKSE